MRCLALVVPCIALIVFNMPVYTSDALASSRDVKNNADLMANNVGVEGPMYLFFGPKTLDLGRQVGFLSRYGLNMFSPKFRPPSPALEVIAHASSLPPCLGAIDFAYGIDDHAVLVEGWLAWSKKRIVSWVVARDGDVIAGGARPLASRPDIGSVLNRNTPTLGFKAGFRLPDDGTAGQERRFRLYGVDPESPQRVCMLAQQAQVGPILIAPIQHVGAFEKLSEKATGFSTSLPASRDIPFLPPPLQDMPFWSVAANQAAELSFTVDIRFIPAGNDLIVPFSGWSIGSNRNLSVRFADGFSAAAALRWPWDKPQVLAAILPRKLLARHPGLFSISIEVGRGPETLSGHPFAGSLDQSWSRLF